MLKKVITFAIFIIVSIVFTGCIYIPPNEHVGKPPPHNYKDTYNVNVNHYYHRY